MEIRSLTAPRNFEYSIITRVQDIVGGSHPCIDGSAEQSRTKHPSITQGEAEDPLPCLGMFFHYSAQKADECLPDGADRQEGHR